jgi:hypothetical protein
VKLKSESNENSCQCKIFYREDAKARRKQKITRRREKKASGRKEKDKRKKISIEGEA